MNIRGRKTAYYAKQDFEAHVAGFVTRAQARVLLRFVGAFLLLLVAAIPLSAQADESEMMVAVKFQYNFGGAIEKSELRLGMFSNSENQMPALDVGLLELRVKMSGGVKPYLLEQPFDGGLAKWGVSQVNRVKSFFAQ